MPFNSPRAEYDAVEGQMQYLKERQRDRADGFRSVMARIAKSKTAEAISILMNGGYEDYLRKNHLDRGKIEILSILAKQEPDIQKFLDRLVELERLIQKGFYSKANNAVILSTIHSSKGLEYDSVYMVDVYDGRFPSSRPNIFSRSKDNADGEQEERRLFYVGITRAKNRLSLFGIKGRESAFIDQLFPEQKIIREQEEAERRKSFFLEQEAKRRVYIETRTSSVVRPSHPYVSQKECPEAVVGMKLLHEDYGELTIIEVENRVDKTIIRVVDSSGETSSKTWNILWAYNKIKLI